MHSHKKKRAVLSAGLGFFLSFSLWIALVSVSLSPGLCSAGTLERSIDRSNYVSNSYQEFVQKSQSMIKENGLNADVEALIPESEVSMDFSKYMKSVFQGKKNVSSQWVSDTISQEILKYLEEEKIEITDSIRQETLKCAKSIEELYQRYFQIPLFKKLYQLGTHQRKILIAAGGLGILISAIIGVILWRMYHHKHRALRYITGAVFSAGIWNLITVYFLRQWLAPEIFKGTSKAYLNLLSTYQTEFLIPFLLVTVLAFFSGGLLAIMGKKTKNMK